MKPFTAIEGEKTDAKNKIDYPAAAAELEAVKALGEKAGRIIGERLAPRFCAAAVANAKSYSDALGDAIDDITDCFEEHSEGDLENPELKENGFLLEESGGSASVQIPGVGSIPGIRNMLDDEAHDIFTQHLYDALFKAVGEACRKAWSDRAAGVRSIFPLVKKR